MDSEIIVFDDPRHKKVKVDETSSIREILHELLESDFTGTHPISLLEGRYSVKELIMAQQVAMALRGHIASVNLIFGIMGEIGSDGNSTDKILSDIKRLIGSDFDLGKLSTDELQQFKAILEKASY